MGCRRRLVDRFLKLVYSDIVEGGQPELLIASMEALLGKAAVNRFDAYNFLRLL